jgi:hypothetical protein
MNEIRKVILGKTTESLLKEIFYSRIAQESIEETYNTLERAIKIKALKDKVISFIKMNPNSFFEVLYPELKLEKRSKISFTNFNDIIDDEEDYENFSHYVIEIDDSYTFANVSKKIKIGKDITLKISG